MNLFIDCEFNGFGGKLISMAIVPENDSLPHLYFALQCANPAPWVALNVIPHLDIEPISRQQAQFELKAFLYGIPNPTVIADWPEDIIHLWDMLLISPGMMMATPDLTTTMLHLPEFNASRQSKKPHNALADAQALRDFYVKTRPK